MPDAIDIALARREDEDWKWEQRLPICAKCGDHINDDWCYEIEGQLYCPDCTDKLFRRDPVDYMTD